MKAEIEKSTILIIIYVKTLLSTIDISSRKKIKKDTLDLKHTLDQIELTDVYKYFIQQHQNRHFFQGPTLGSPG